MKLTNRIQYLIGALVPVVGLALFSSSAWASNYAQLSSLDNQTGDSSKVASLDTVDGIEGMSHNKTSVTVKQAGIYFVMAAGQVGSTSKEASGNVDLWLTHNGKALSNSNTRYMVRDGNDTNVLISQTILKLKAGDSIGVGYSGTNSALGLISTAASNGEPAIPSIIFSMHKI
jgi:hypothetical protein